MSIVLSFHLLHSYSSPKILLLFHHSQLLRICVCLHKFYFARHKSNIRVISLVTVTEEDLDQKRKKS